MVIRQVIVVYCGPAPRRSSHGRVLPDDFGQGENRKCIINNRLKKFVLHLDLLGVLLAATTASHARLGHVTLEDTILDVLRVVFLALLCIYAAEEDTLHVLVGLGAQEEHECGNEYNAPFPRDRVSKCMEDCESVVSGLTKRYRGA